MSPSGHGYERLYEYDVIGAGLSAIGSARNFWLKSGTHELEFLGVRVEALMPYTHVIPADVLDIDDTHRTITVPYTEDKIRGAPHFGLHDPITEADRERIYAYYGVEPPH